MQESRAKKPPKKKWNNVFMQYFLHTYIHRTRNDPAVITMTKKVLANGTCWNKKQGHKQSHLDREHNYSGIKFFLKLLYFQFDHIFKKMCLTTFYFLLNQLPLELLLPIESKLPLELLLTLEISCYWNFCYHWDFCCHWNFCCRWNLVAIGTFVAIGTYISNDSNDCNEDWW